jgi:Protein of unknown function (DUF2946)
MLLVVALLFGQIGAGFLHSKHDAHQTVAAHAESKQPVLLHHGEHCKVCAVDWVHQFVATTFSIITEVRLNEFPTPQPFISLAELSLPNTIGRAPPLS